MRIWKNAKCILAQIFAGNLQKSGMDIDKTEKAKNTGPKLVLFRRVASKERCSVTGELNDDP